VNSGIRELEPGGEQLFGKACTLTAALRQVVGIGLRMGGVGSARRDRSASGIWVRLRGYAVNLFIHPRGDLFALIKVNFPYSRHKRAAMRLSVVVCCRRADEAALNSGFPRNCSTSLSGVLLAVHVARLGLS
jgi:hypothetical protein